MAALGLALYRAGTRAFGGLAPSLLARRAARGKEDPERLGERLGRASAPRPEGPLVWLHGASVGESLVLRALIAAIARERGDLAFLITTGTTTSAEMMATRLPERAIHQYAPVDQPAAVRAFLAHWRPQLGVFAESELWPNLLTEAKAQGARLALVNARLTAGSLAGWARWPASAREVLMLFDWIGAADARTAEGLGRLAGRPVTSCGNLKFDARPPAADADELAALREGVGGRDVWLAASTHEGEDEIALAAHKALRAADGRPWLLLVAPRHPERGARVAELAREAGFAVRRRSAGERPDAEADVYVADTMGEMGLWFRLAGTAFMGGSIVPGVGGHNPLEPALLRCPLVTGPHTYNFEAIYDELVAAGGAARVRNAHELAEEIGLLDAENRAARAESAHSVAQSGANVLEKVMGGLRPLLPDRADD